MPLKARVTLLVLLALIGLSGVFLSILWARDHELTHRYQDAVLGTKQLAWNKLQNESISTLRQTVEQAVSSTPNDDRSDEGSTFAKLGAVLERALAKHPGWRADIYDARGLLRYTTVPLVPQPEPLVAPVWVSHMLSGSPDVEGLVQVSRDQYMFLASRAFVIDNNVGVVAVGLDVAPLLSSLNEALQGSQVSQNNQIFLLNLRGRTIAIANPQGPFITERYGFSVRTPRADEVSDADHSWLATMLPLLGPDDRQVAALFLFGDIDAQQVRDARMRWGMTAGGLFLVIVLSTLVFLYLWHALQPLERSVRVLDALAQGNLNVDLDSEEETADEASRIAKGVSALRQEMLNLEMLRDERNRTRQQQERLIRNALKRLAKILNEKTSRADILQALQPDKTNTDAESNELADLATILARMSELVTTQQGKLVRLLKQLHAAMQKQSLLVSLQQELEIARRMQQSILPNAAPNSPSVSVSAFMVPATEVGGDFYDYFLIDQNRLALAIADVSGKGVPAAFFMAIARTLLKNNVMHLHQPSLIMKRLNQELCADNEQVMFVTVFLGILEFDTGKLVYVNAGHNPPVLYRNKTASYLRGQKNMALGVSDTQDYQEDTLMMQSGEMLLLYTDGVTEAADPAGTLFGEERLLATIQGHAGGPLVPPSAKLKSLNLPAKILETIRQFESGTTQADDITCVAIKYLGCPDLAQSVQNSSSAQRMRESEASTALPSIDLKASEDVRRKLDRFV